MITKSRFQFLIREVFDSIKGLTATKGEEYTGDEDQLANFKRMAVDADLPIEKVWLLFFMKHVDAIKSYVRTGKEKSESIESRIDDAILYLILLRAVVLDSREEGVPERDVTIAPVYFPDPLSSDARENRRSGKERRQRDSQGYAHPVDRRAKGKMPRRKADQRP
jgi:hypothetical protein